MTINYCRRPKPSPLSFVLIRHIMTVTSICLTIICIFIVHRSSSVTRVYSKLLILLLLGSTLADIYIQWVYDPVFVFPRICVYRRDPLLNFPFSARFGHSAMQSMIASGGPIYIALFIYRHQALVLPGSKFKFSTKTQISFVVALILPYTTIGISVYIGHIPRSNQLEYEDNMSDVWDPVILERIACFSFNTMYLYWAYGCILPTFTTVFLFAVARHTFAMLKKVSHISTRMQQKHRILTISLIIQSLLPVIIVIIPFGAMMLFTTSIFYISPGFYDSITISPADYTILCISFHATAHCIALIATTPVFRRTLVQLVFRREERTVSVPTASASAFTVS